MFGASHFFLSETYHFKCFSSKMIKQWQYQLSSTSKHVKLISTSLRLLDWSIQRSYLTPLYLCTRKNTGSIIYGTFPSVCLSFGFKKKKRFGLSKMSFHKLGIDFGQILKAHLVQLQNCYHEAGRHCELRWTTKATSQNRGPNLRYAYQ